MLDENFSLSPGVRLDGHHHARLHLCLVLDGGFVEREGSRWRECRTGTVRISPAGTSHRLQVEAGGAHGRILELRPAATRGLLRPLEQSVYLPRPAPNRWVDHLDPIEAECQCLELVARATLPNPLASPPRWLTQMHEELTLDTRHSLSKVAREFDRHRSHVARSFRGWFGRSIGEHLRARRAIEAARRLRNGDQPVAQMAHELGFVDQAHLTRVFRSFYGMPPARYRRAAS